MLWNISRNFFGKMFWPASLPLGHSHLFAYECFHHVSPQLHLHDVLWLHIWSLPHGWQCQHSRSQLLLHLSSVQASFPVLPLLAFCFVLFFVYLCWPIPSSTTHFSNKSRGLKTEWQGGRIGTCFPKGELSGDISDQPLTDSERSDMIGHRSWSKFIYLLICGPNC